jgi:serine/threonine protein kinase
MQFHRKAGTLDYAPPEIFQGRISDRSDQYSLAVTYCHLRGGRLPFSDTPTSFTRSYVRPKPDLTMLDPAERPIVARALDPVPQQRWPSSVEMMQQLAMLFT